MEQLGFGFAPAEPPVVSADPEPQTKAPPATLEAPRSDLDAIRRTITRIHKELKPRTELPYVQVRFRAYNNVDSRIRLSPDRTQLTVSLSDALEGAPDTVMEALAYILVAKLYRKPQLDSWSAAYNDYVNRPEMRALSRRMKRERSQKRLVPPRGVVYDLDEIFDRLNARHFDGGLRKPKLGWSAVRARRALGHYDAAHEAIVVSRIFDHHRVPAYVVEYVMYHEMLHIKHPVEVRGGRRVVHSAAFRREEKAYPGYMRANDWIRRKLG